MERPTGDVEEVAVDTAEVNIGQLSQGRKSDLLELLHEYRDRGLFTTNPRWCHETKLRMPLTREDCRLYEAEQRRYSPDTIRDSRRGYAQNRISGCPWYTMGPEPMWIWTQGFTSRLLSLR